MKYPTVEQVQSAPKMLIFKWYLLLKNPSNEREYELLNLVCAKCHEYGGIDETIKRQILTGVKV